MKRLLMLLLTGLALTACGKDKVDEVKEPTTAEETVKDTKVKYLEDLGYTNIANTNGEKTYQTYTLNEATAIDENIYGQWVFTWVEPADYVEKDIDVYQYTATKDNKDYDVFVMMDTDDNVIGGYYYENGKTIEDAKILHKTHEPRLVEDFKETWNRLFHIDEEK